MRRLESVTDPATYVAAFLVARGASAIFQIAVQPMFVLDYAQLFPSLRLQPGKPKASAEEVAPGVFLRDFSNLTVRFDCNHFNASFEHR